MSETNPLIERTVLTETGFFLVVKDPAEAQEKKEKYSKLSRSDFLDKMSKHELTDLNDSLTYFLNDELPPQAFPDKKSFRNDLSHLPDYPQIEKIGDYVALFDYKPVQDNEIPSMIKKLGYTIEADIRDMYLELDRAGELHCLDKDKKNINDNDDYYFGHVAYIDSNSFLMHFKMSRYLFKKEDFQKYLEIKNKIKNDPNHLATLPYREQNLYSIISQAHAKQKHQNSSFIHESKHLKNHFLRERRQIKEGVPKLSCEDIYRINVEDERSADVAVLIEAINNYFKNGDHDLLNIIRKDKPWLDNLLKGKTPDEVKAILSDHALLINSCIKDWNKNNTSEYNKLQFEGLCTHQAQNYTSRPDDVNHEEYNRQLSLFYSFDVYNPQTGKTETKDLSKLITVDVDINEEGREIIEKSKERRKIASETINKPGWREPILAAIKHAEEMLREKIRKTDTYLNTNEHQTEKNSPEQKKQPKSKISVEENIPEPKNKPQTTPDKGFAKPYRQFYQNVAKQEKSQYSEDETSPYYKAKLTRKNGEELNIVATPENRISLGCKDKDKKPKIPDYKDFNDLALLAKKTGQKIIFGDIKSPEFKARLMLACLENDIEMNNLPDISELKDIEPETKERLKKQKNKIQKRTEKNNQKNTATPPAPTNAVQTQQVEAQQTPALQAPKPQIPTQKLLPAVKSKGR